MGEVGTDGQREPDEVRLHAILDALEEGVLALDPDSTVVTANPTALRILGVDRADLDGAGWWQRLRPRAPDGRPIESAPLAEEDLAVRIAPPGCAETREIVVRRTPLPDGGSVITVRAPIVQPELRDAATGLPDRAAGLAAIEDALAVGSPSAVLLLDVDGFKAVNVGLGQRTGDAVLRELAGRLRAVAPRAAHVARFGGDHFLVVAPADGPRAARALGDRLQDAFVAPFAAGDGAMLTASIGVACSRSAGDVAGLVRAAEAALAVARARGRGLISVYDDALRRHDAEKAALVADLRRAIDGDGLRIAYQPILTLGRRRSRIVAVEALARWTHPERGDVSPAAFVALAEEVGLIRALGRRVLARACMEIARLRAAVPAAAELRVSVNVSARQVASGLLGHDVRAALTASGLPAEALALELTESALVDDSPPALEALTGLRELGVSLLIDDFGIGYSSLTRLRRLPVDGLKIDRSFVAGLGEAPVESAIVEAVLTMARALELPVVAEGVERDEQVARLRALRCDAVQGFLLGRPMGLDDLRRRIDREDRTLHAMGADR